MNILNIRLGCRCGDVLPLKHDGEHSLILGKAPAAITVGRERTVMVSDWLILCDGGMIHSVGKALGYDIVKLRLSDDDRHYIEAIGFPINTPVEIKDDYLISGFLKGMSEQFIRGGRNISELLDHAMRVILLSAAGTLDSEDISSHEISRLPELKKLREEIYSYPGRDWRSDKISEKLGISKAYFHRIYLAAFGMTCHRDVIESRLQKASELLRHTDLLIGEVAERCGYESDYYFMRQFRQYKGCTPSEYREKARTEI